MTLGLAAIGISRSLCPGGEWAPAARMAGLLRHGHEFRHPREGVAACVLLVEQPRRTSHWAFTVTPFLIDHSAFDAYMMLIEVHGKRILYSGDFRTHGRKSALTRRLMAAPPENLDVLLMEGTNLGSDKPCVTESNLEDSFVDLFRSTAGRVFVAWSAQNVDRTVTLYRACLKAGRTLVIDLYTAEVLESLAEFGKLRRPGRKNLKVVVTRAFARMYRRRLA